MKALLVYKIQGQHQQVTEPFSVEAGTTLARAQELGKAIVFDNNKHAGKDGLQAEFIRVDLTDEEEPFEGEFIDAPVEVTPKPTKKKK